MEVQVNKSPIDKRSYRYFTLENDLKVLVISDPQTDLAAASLSVHVGQFHDPIDRQGLAHFLEHMLFLGTEKYPVEGEYKKFITANGGGTNASTSQEMTSYFFRIKNDALESGLDRFAQFFIRGSTDGFSSSDTAICQATDGADNFSGNSDIDGGGNEMNTLYDVQNTSNNKIRFSVEFQGGSNTTLIGSSGGQGITTAMFIRLGDT